MIKIKGNLLWKLNRYYLRMNEQNSIVILTYFHQYYNSSYRNLELHNTVSEIVFHIFLFLQNDSASEFLT